MKIDETGLDDIIDLSRYPIDALETQAGKRLIARCARDLESKALCLLPAFVRQSALSRMVKEAESLISRAYYRQDVMKFSGDEQADKKWPVGHPNRADIPGRYRQVLSEDIPTNHLLRRLYMWSGLTEFIRLVFGFDTMYRSHCPHLSLTLKIAGPGDTDGWHYDGNDGVVSLLLQKPDNGGQFEYAPYIRSPNDERYDALGRVFADPRTHAERPYLAPGTFVLFNGNLSVHRVTPVGETTQPRIVSLLSYDRHPDQVFSPEYVEYMRRFPTDAKARATL